MLFVQVIGKALMLDEIINYVQSLQRQVEVSSRAPFKLSDAPKKFSIRNSYQFHCFFCPQFLSMKLATVNPLDFSNLPTLLQKDVSSNFPLLSMSCPVMDQSNQMSSLLTHTCRRQNSDVPSLWPFSKLSLLAGKLQLRVSVQRPWRCVPVVRSKRLGEPVRPESVGPGSVSCHQWAVWFSGRNSRHNKPAGN